ncbi:Bgr_08870 family protein [Bartonella sp. CB60]|uniref:Bgr_08870 family protein n=1 Tax=Bartonella sp. CB60 TaxID=3113619 RepID=UPI00300E0DD1
MSKTKKLNMELPKERRFISSEFPILRNNLTIIDQAIADVDKQVKEKAPLQHTHEISGITGLEAALNGKMPADKSFSLAGLKDVEGAQDAANNYVLYKLSNNHFTFGSAKSLLGAHQHRIEDIVGLDGFRDKVNESFTAYGCLTKANEWQSYNKFNSKVTISGGLELLGNSSLNLTYNGELVISLSTSGSTLKGPLKVDGDIVCTKPEVDVLEKEIKKIKNGLIDKLINWSALADVELLYRQDGKIQWPDWVTDQTKVEIQAWGGGGSGGGADTPYLGGGGGGGGCTVWYGYKISLSGHEDITIGLGGTSVAARRATGKFGGTTVIGKNFITATGGCGGGGGYYTNSSNYSTGRGGVGGIGGNFGLATDAHPGIAKGGNGYSGTNGSNGGASGHGGNAGGDTSRGGSGGVGNGSYVSGKGGRGFGGGGAGAHGDFSSSGAGADGAVLIRLWKD